MLLPRQLAVATLAGTAAMILPSGIPGLPSAAGCARTTAPRGCAPDPDYTVNNKQAIFQHSADYTSYGRSGTNLSISISQGDSWSGSLTGTVGAEAGVIFAKTSTSVRTTIEKSRTSGADFGGSWTVPANQSTGWIGVGAAGFRFTWQYGHDTPSCTYVVDRSGVGQYPGSGSLFWDHS